MHFMEVREIKSVQKLFKIRGALKFVREKVYSKKYLISVVNLKYDLNLIQNFIMVEKKFE